MVRRSVEKMDADSWINAGDGWLQRYFETGTGCITWIWKYAGAVLLSVPPGSGILV